MNRKLRKLIRDPKLFFVDMYKKRINQIKKYLPIKRTGKANILLLLQYIMLRNI